MSTRPPFLLDKPAPQIKQRLYNGRRILVWEGKVKISSITGWIDNPRIDIAKRQYISVVGERQLTQEEIFDLMKTVSEVKLKQLRDDVIKNGLREPLALSFSGKLLDGNRRFFAVKYALENMPITDPNRQDLESVDAYVLTENATEEDEQNVLVEENFSASLKIEWPDYVKAIKVVEAAEEGMTPDQISKKFSWPKAKIKETLRIQEITNEFMIYATADPDPEDDLGGGLGLSEQDAEGIVAEFYQYFNEAQKSFFDALKTDFDFKIQFFKWINQRKFSSFLEVRVAHSAWKHPQAKAALMQPNASSAKDAKAYLDFDNRINRITEDAAVKIETFVKFLRGMTAAEIKAIPSTSRDNLEQALEMVIKMSKVASE